MIDTQVEKNQDMATDLNKARGLSEAEVLSQRAIFGENVLPEAKGRSAWSIFLAQFKNPLIYIIFAAAIISLLMGESGDSIIIMAVVIVNVMLGFGQEYKAQQTYKALKNMLKMTANVIRDGAQRSIDVQELVPGDLAVLNAGERVPADGKIIRSTKLSIDEAILTGESEPVNKDNRPDKNRVFMGTTIVTGRAYFLVHNTGSNTELGKIAASQRDISQPETPLQIRLRHFARTLTYLVIGITLAILVSGLLSGRPFLEMLLLAIVLAVAAVPEGLPIAVTIAQVRGMRRILDRNGLVQNLLAVETLGSVTVICTDKTGTLTEGNMRVVRSDFSDQQRALETMVLCNNLEGAVDAALWAYAREGLGGDPGDMVRESERQGEKLFTSDTKYMVTKTKFAGEIFLHMKGAPEIVLGMCQLDDNMRSIILQQIDAWAGSGLRILGFAYKSEGAVDDTQGFIWNGLVGMEDPIREGVLEAIQVAHRAGIKVKMITGDYRLTAKHIATKLGLLSDQSQIVEGKELGEIDDDQLRERMEDITVFARITPFDKLRIVQVLQEKGEVTAMIGDGVNDAPALKKANIGVVVGSATDVAKETSDLILLDNNFRTIVTAIEEGRVIFANIQKVVAYVLSNSFTEILTMFTAIMLGWPAPLLVAQILWINLICDGPADIMLGFEPKEEGVMLRKPTSLKENVLNTLGLSLIVVISTSAAVAALLLFGSTLRSGGDVNLGRSYVFAVLAVIDMVYIFSYRNMRSSIWKTSSPLSNKPLLVSVAAGFATVIAAFAITPLRDMLKLVPLSPAGYALVFAIAVLMLIIVEAAKLLNRRGKSSY